MIYTEIFNILVAAILSGLLSTIITIIVQKKMSIKRIKEDVFCTLMSHRYLIYDKENVEALNRVEVLFYKEENVRKAWRDFLDCSNSKSSNPNEINDKYIKLLDEIAKSLRYEKIEWDDIKKYYYPQGLAEKIIEENMLRKSQLAHNSQNPQNREGADKINSDQLGMQLLQKAFEEPALLNRLIDLAEKDLSKKQKK